MPRRNRSARENKSPGGEGSTRPEGVLTRSSVLRAARPRRAPSAEAPGGGDDEDAGEGRDGGRVRPTKKKHFHGCFSTDHVQEVISSFGEKKLSILHKIGLGSLLHLKPGMNHSRALVCWLLKRIDATRMCLVLDKGDEIELTNKSVHHILGVRCEGNDIPVSTYVAEDTKLKIHEIFSTTCRETMPTIEDARKILVADYGEEMSNEETEKFSVALAAFVSGYMFGPLARAAEVPKNILDFISTPGNLENCNWGSYILQMVRKSASGLQRKLGLGGGVEKQPHSLLLGGCWLYLELLYLDNIDFGVLNVPLSWFPRVRVYDKHTIQDFISLDEEPKKSGKFGHKERRHPCPNDDVPESGWQTTPSGVRMHVGCSRDKKGKGLTGKGLEGKIEERFAKIMDLLRETKKLAYEESRKAFELHESCMNNIFGGLEKNLEEERRQLVVYASHYESNLKMRNEDIVDPGPHVSTDEVRGETGEPGVSVPVSTTNQDIADTQGVPTRGQCTEEVVETGLTEDVGQSGNGPEQIDLPRGTLLDEWANLFQQEVQQPHLDDRNIEIERLDGNKHVAQEPVDRDGADGNGHNTEEHVEGNSGSSYQDVPADGVWEWTTSFSMDVGEAGSMLVNEGRFDETPPGATPHRTDFHGMHQEVPSLGGETPMGEEDTGPVGQEARYDATPAATSLKRKRIKKSGSKNSRKVCSSKRVCRERIVEGNNIIVEMAEEQVEEGTQVMDGIVREVPRTRHVGERCVDSPPFHMALRYHQLDSRKIEPKYRGVMKDTGAHLQRYWVILKQPRELKIAGQVLQQEFKKSVHLTRETFCAIVRLLQLQQTWLYMKHAPNRNQWKHFMDPSFAEIAIGNKEFMVTDDIRAMFLGDHLGSKFEHSRMVMVPSNARGYWCLYVWDMVERKVHVLDPCSAGVPLAELKRRHECYVHDLHEALSTCKREIFTGWDDNFDDYQCICDKGAHPTTKREGDSGIYVVHYMRWFDGETVVYKMDEKDALRIRKWLLIDLLTMNGNTGEVPSYIKEVVVVDD